MNPEGSPLESYVYIFVRTDLAIQHQIVQSCHAAYHLAGFRCEQGTPNIVLIGLPNIASLRRAERKLESANIPHYSWSEPDNDWGLTAIATAPLTGEQRKVMANYRIYNASVAQTGRKEHSVLTEGSQVQSLPEAPDLTASTEASVRV